MHSKKGNLGMLKFLKNLKKFMMSDPWNCDTTWHTTDTKTAASIPVVSPSKYYILDPHQNMKCSMDGLLNQITGPFFSWESAYKHITMNVEKFSNRAEIVKF